MRTWFAVDVPKFYAPITSLLSLTSDRMEWQGLKTLGQLKREKGIKSMPNEDSLYKVYLHFSSFITPSNVNLFKPVTREERVFAPFKTLPKLEKELPFRFKNKESAKPLNPLEKQRVAILREPKEAKVSFINKERETSKLKIFFIQLKDGSCNENV
jgi:ribosome biogenesis protein BMS1